MTPHLFAILRTVHEAIDPPLVGSRSRVGQERVHLGHRGREPPEVHAEASQQRRSIRLGSQRHSFTTPSIRQKSIDRAGGFIRYQRGLNLTGGFKGPVFLIGSPLLNPSAQEVLLGGTNRLVGFRRRHDRVRILRLKTLPEFARFQIAGPNGYAALLVGSKSSLSGVQTEAGFTLLGVQSMARKAIVGKDGADVLIEGQVYSQGRNNRDHRHRRDPPECALNHADGIHGSSVS